MGNLRIADIIRGSGTPVERIYNAGCFIAMVFCVIAAVESYVVGLSVYVVAANALYSATLAFLYYLSRITHRHGASRILGIAMLVFLYMPAIWFFNGGSGSGIPYFIVMFISFIGVLTVEEGDTLRKRILPIAVLIVDICVVAGLIYAEYAYPQKIYVFPTRSAKYIDMASGMVIAVLGNYFILKAFVWQHYKDLGEIKIYSRRLEELVQMDSMTSILNHSCIIERLGFEIEKAFRYNRPLSVIMFDLDFFKKINDTCGHQFGDEVLIAVARALKKCSRNVDIAARYGGEEFLLVLPETNAESALVVAERLRSYLQELVLSRPVKITVSGGIAQYANGDSAHEMIKRADDLLYKAKDNGRDQICL